MPDTNRELLGTARSSIDMAAGVLLDMPVIDVLAARRHRLGA